MQHAALKRGVKASDDRPLAEFARLTEKNSTWKNESVSRAVSFQNTNSALAVGVGSSVALFRGWSSGSDELDSLSESEKPTIETKGVVAH